MRYFFALAICGSLAVFGCSSDTNNTGGSGGSGGSGATAGMGGSGGVGGMGGSAGTGGTGGSSAAKAFCDDYETICGFGDGFADEAACEAGYDGFSSERQACVETHLGFAVDQNDTETHCPHAAGAAPCN